VGPRGETWKSFWWEFRRQCGRRWVQRWGQQFRFDDGSDAVGSTKGAWAFQGKREWTSSGRHTKRGASLIMVHVGCQVSSGRDGL